MSKDKKAQNKIFLGQESVNEKEKVLRDYHV